MNHRRFFLLQTVMVCLLTGFYLVVAPARGQVPSKENQEPHPGFFIIHKITITGNKITRPRIITRELKFRELDTIPAAGFRQLLVTSRQNVFNTGLFNFVTIDTASADNRQLIDIHISVVERWYIWPIPLLEISERNFNIWWETRDFRRLTYGIDFTFNNFRGRNETLRLLAHFGYNQLYGFSYKIPNLNRKQTIGLTVGAGIEMNHEMTVQTLNNRTVNVKDSAYIKRIIYGYSDMQLRPSFHTTHTFRLSYNYYIFSANIDTVPGFSLSGSHQQWFLAVSYLFRNDHRDAAYYPLTGYYFELELNHTFPYGSAHNSYIKTKLKKYWQLLHRVYFATGFTGKVSFEKYQPYFLQRGLGYSQDFVRGYEYYVVDGQHFALIKSDLKFALVPQRVIKIGFIKTTKFNTIPLALYLDLFADIGYCYNYQRLIQSNKIQGNTLENSLMEGIGLGINFATYYDVVFRFEGSINRMGKTGFALHFASPI
ncbi:MAG: BamA/TamA family outer membrane protein [Bacteroidota bacterium]